MRKKISLVTTMDFDRFRKDMREAIRGKEKPEIIDNDIDKFYGWLGDVAETIMKTVAWVITKRYCKGAKVINQKIDGDVLHTDVALDDFTKDSPDVIDFIMSNTGYGDDPPLNVSELFSAKEWDKMYSLCVVPRKMRKLFNRFGDVMFWFGGISDIEYEKYIKKG